MKTLIRQKGISQILVLIVMGILAVALPTSVKLVERSQDNRSSASEYSDFCTKDSDIGNKMCKPGSDKFILVCAKKGGSYEKIFADEQCSNGCENGKCKTGTKVTTTRYKKGSCNTSTQTYSCTKVKVANNNESEWNATYKDEGSCKYADGCGKDVVNYYKTSAPAKVPGSCGSSNGKSGSIKPSSNNLCSKGSVVGSVKFSNSNNYWYWICSNDGINSGLCTYKKKSTTFTVSCSSSNCSACITSSICISKSGCTWDYNNFYCSKKTILTTDNTEPIIKEDGKCSTITKEVCTTGTRQSVTDSNSHYLWNCIGKNGGSAVSCSKKKTSSSTTNDTSTPINTPIPTVTVGSSNLSFRIAFAGLLPNQICLDTFTEVNVTVGKKGEDVSQDLIVIVNPVEGVVNSDGLQVFEANNISLDSKFDGSNNIYVDIKGIMHAKMSYCKQNQNSKYSGQVCDLVLDGSVNDLSEYMILAGDIDQDGTINSLDYSYIKNRLAPSEEPICSKEGDLNGDGVVNNFDIRLIRNALSYRDDG